MRLIEPSLPNLSRLAEHVLAIWPEHERYLDKSVACRDRSLLEFSEHIAKIVLRLGDDEVGGIGELCRDYRFICQDVVLPEEVFFRRNGRYRLSTFEDALRTVYSNTAFMTRYMNGLLVTDVLWVNHCQCLHHYATHFVPNLREGADLLEIGPGHGLLLKLALDAGTAGSMEAWDVSEASLLLSQKTLAVFGQIDEVAFAKRNIFEPAILDKANANRFDGVVLSEVLEHLEEPLSALKAIAHILRPEGRVWVNVPANSPAPDHLYLVRKPQEAVDIVRAAGFNIVDVASFPMSGVTLQRAIDHDLTVSCVVVGEKPRA